MKRNEVKAVITENWSHFNSKFFPGDKVKVEMRLYPNHCYGKKYISHNRREGIVWAATCGPDGKRRSRKTTWYGRCYTRYYVEFEDGTTQGIHSHHLTKI